MLGAVKNMGITPWDALHRYSYANISLFAAALPVYIPKKERGERGEVGGADRYKGTIYSHESVRADDPKQQQYLMQLIKTARE